MALFKVGEKNHCTPHTEEAKKKCSEAQKKRWAEGKYKNRVTISEETKKKIKNTLMTGKYLNCFSCNKKIYVTKSKLKTNKRFYCSRECSFKGNSGENNYNWKGGYPEYKHQNNRFYKRWREKVFKRDDYTCQICSKRGCHIHPHHKMSYTFYPNARYDVNNGVTLCVKCHRWVHN